jgi:two-component system chemotaxis response regulator CheB
MDGQPKSKPGRPIRVVVGEDSLVMQRVIASALERDSDITVVGKGSDGQAVLKMAAELRPDCITLDLEMPNMNGLEALRYLMSEWPTPVVIVSGYAMENADLVLTCLEYGAVDFVAKTCGGGPLSTEELVAKVKAAAAIDVRRVRFAPSEIEIGAKAPATFAPSLRAVVVIGASTGGPQALMEIIPRLPRDIPAGIVIVQHMPANFTRYLAQRLDGRSGLDVREAGEGDEVLPGRALIAPGGSHVFLAEREGRPCVTLVGKNALQRTVCPSIDFTMTSFAPVFREHLIGVVLTGMGRDGAGGAAAIHRNGGKVICQDKESSLIFGMPGVVIGEGLADAVCSVDRIADSIVWAVQGMECREHAHEHE